MTSIQIIIVSLWLVPVAGFIVLPLLWSLYGVFYRAVERSRLSDISGFVALNNRDAETGKPEKRERSRIRLEKGVACIAAASDCCRAKVSDISRHGLCLSNIPGNMRLESSPWRVVFRTRQKDYTLTVRPIWKKMAGKEYVIGAELDQISTEWQDLIKGLRQSPTAVRE
jgi:hypothetical protein